MIIKKLEKSVSIGKIGLPLNKIMYVENCSLEPNLKKGTFKRLQNN